MSANDDVETLVSTILTDAADDAGAQADCLLALAFVQHQKSGRDRPFAEQARITTRHLEGKDIPDQIHDRIDSTA